ncbi:MAG: hypothetical protein HKN32_03660 [Flavobacteriales bacterium]|nr:hypothetical protein [Flavobacteriales bacterium]
MNSKLLNLNEFMSEELDDGTGSETNEEASEMSVIELPGNVDFGLTSSIDKMIYDDIEMTNVGGKIRLFDHRAQLENLAMNLLDGRVVMNGEYYAPKEKEPIIDFDFGIDKMSIKKSAEKFNTIDKLAPIATSCSGTFSTDMKLSAILDRNMNPKEETIEGGGQMRTQSVYIEKFEPLTKLAEELKIEKLSKQNIEDLKLTYLIDEGKAIVDPFTVKIEGVETTISGYTTILNQEMAYDLKMDLPVEKLPGALAGQASGALADLNKKFGTNLSIGDKIPVNVKVTGTVDKPTISANYGEVAKGAAQDLKEELIETAKEEVQEKIDEVKDDAKEKAQAEANKIMEDARNEADKLMADAKSLADQARDAAYNEAQKLVDGAKNPLDKAAKKIAADKIKKEADNAHSKALAEAQKKADNILAQAQQRADEKINSVE